MKGMLARLAEDIWPPLVVWLAGILFAIPTVALVSFALLATGWITPEACF